FRIRQGEFITTPAPPAGHEWVFEYVSKNFIEYATLPAGRFGDKFEADDDEILLPNDIVQADLTWRWKKEKGLAYAQDFDDCEDLVVNALGRDGAGAQILDMGLRGDNNLQPGIFVP